MTFLLAAPGVVLALYAFCQIARCRAKQGGAT